MAKPFKKLRMLMTGEDIGRQEVAEALGRSRRYVDVRMIGSAPWTLQEVYILCDMFGIPYIDIPAYFPKEDCKA